MKGCCVWVNLGDLGDNSLHVTPIEDIQETDSGIISNDAYPQKYLEGFYCVSIERRLNLPSVKNVLCQGIDYNLLLNKEGLTHPFLLQPYDISIIGTEDWIRALNQVYCFYVEDDFNTCARKLRTLMAEMNRRMKELGV